MAPSVREQWISNIQKDADSFPAILSRDLFEDWHLNRMPEDDAEQQIAYAAELLYAQDNRGLDEQFLRRGLAIVDRMFKENRFEGYLRRDDIPNTSKAGALWARTFATALLGGLLDREALKQSAEEYVTWALDGTWDDMTEDAYLKAVRLFLIAGDVDKARGLFKIRRKFKSHDEQAGLLRELAAANDRPIRDLDILARFDAVFDPLRPPLATTNAFTRVSRTRLELGAIRDKYFVSENGEIDWRRTIDGISR